MHHSQSICKWANDRSAKGKLIQKHSIYMYAIFVNFNVSLHKCVMNVFSFLATNFRFFCSRCTHFTSFYSSTFPLYLSASVLCCFSSFPQFHFSLSRCHSLLFRKKKKERIACIQCLHGLKIYACVWTPNTHFEIRKCRCCWLECSGFILCRNYESPNVSYGLEMEAHSHRLSYIVQTFCYCACGYSVKVAKTSIECVRHELMLCINMGFNIQRHLSVKQTWQLYFMVL